MSKALDIAVERRINLTKELSDEASERTGHDKKNSNYAFNLCFARLYTFWHIPYSFHNESLAHDRERRYDRPCLFGA